jgi:GlcNAc-P-P-Und epimerase
MYMSNRQTRKAGGYVKELSRVAQFGLEQLDTQKQSTLLLNFSMDPLPALEDFVASIQRTAGLSRHPINVPRWALLGASYPIAGVARTFGIRTPISPVRVRKLSRSNAFDPRGLRELGYRWRFTLDEAFADWKRDAPGDFSK